MVSIRASGGHALVYDRTGEFTAAFYEEDRDIIINPFDQRSHCWSPFNDAETAEGFTQIYDVLIPTSSGDKDPFWSKSMGTSVYATLLAELRFLEFLRDDGPKYSARKWVKSIFDVDTVDPKTGEVIQAPKPARTKSDPSKDGSFVFLTGHPEYDAATRNITSAIMELAATATVFLSSPANSRKCAKSVAALWWVSRF